MTNKSDPLIQILLTNDDGIESPGLWAAAEALSSLGFVHVVAPREQSTGAGRSMPNNSDGIIRTLKIIVKGQPWEVHAVGGTPAQAVQHGILEVLPEKPNIVVSGINYGENLGTGVTISGTVGAALEGANLGVPAIAASLETDIAHHLSYSNDIDFSIAAHFTTHFAKILLRQKMPFDVDVLKLDIPASANLKTPWKIAHLSRKRYYEPLPPNRKSWNEPGKPDYRHPQDFGDFDPDSDVYILRAKKYITVTPLSLDLTSRTDFKRLQQLLESAG